MCTISMRSRHAQPIMLLASLCVLLLVAVVTLAGCQEIGNVATSAPAATATLAKGRSSLLGDGDPQIYWDTIKHQVAQGLHRRVADLTELWSAPPGGVQKGASMPAPTTITDVATREGLSRMQLTTLELSAIQSATTALVQQGTLTQTAADARMGEIRGWGMSELDGYTMYAFATH